MNRTSLASNYHVKHYTSFEIPYIVLDMGTGNMLRVEYISPDNKYVGLLLPTCEKRSIDATGDILKFSKEDILIYFRHLSYSIMRDHTTQRGVNND